LSKLDLRCGYWQVDVHLEKTAYSTPQLLWQITFMPFGLCKSPAKFERLMEKVLRGLTHDSHLLYLDDVIVIGRTLDEHLLNLPKVFKWFLVDRIKFNSEKCQLLQKEVRYLGNIILPKWISTDPEKLKAVPECPIQKNKNEI
jgi:hypothetical protein